MKMLIREKFATFLFNQHYSSHYNGHFMLLLVLENSVLWFSLQFFKSAALLSEFWKPLVFKKVYGPCLEKVPYNEGFSAAKEHFILLYIGLNLSQFILHLDIAAQL